MKNKRKKHNSNFSLRQCQLNQVQRDYLNSLQNTPKASAKLIKKRDSSILFVELINKDSIVLIHKQIEIF